MAIRGELNAELSIWAGGDAQRVAVAQVIGGITNACAQLAARIAEGPLAGQQGAATGAANADGDAQRVLDVAANDLLLAALRATPVAYCASEEEEDVLTLDPKAPLAVAMDPLDGSSNIDVNVSIGTIFALYPAAKTARDSFLRPCAEQIAAGYVIYGPHVALLLSVGDGTDLYVLHQGRWQLAKAGVQVPVSANEFAINASNYRHWQPPVRAYIDDCLAGTDGPRGRNFNMRWVASLVAETHRILSRGGVFLYPGDTRKGYEQGRLRLLYECAPIAMLTEQAGGAATDGSARILDKPVTALHQRTPFVFGSREKVARIARYHNDPGFQRSSAPLFGVRGLFRE